MRRSRLNKLIEEDTVGPVYLHVRLRLIGWSHKETQVTQGPLGHYLILYLLLIQGLRGVVAGVLFRRDICVVGISLLLLA